MELGLTIPLRRFLHMKEPMQPAGADEHCWDMHVIELDGARALLIVNCASRYSVTLRDPDAEQWKNIADTALKAIEDALISDGFDRDSVTAYMAASGGAKLTRTHGRREVAYLNRAWEAVMAADMLTDTTKRQQDALNSCVNAAPCRCAGFEGAEAPRARMSRVLSDIRN